MASGAGASVESSLGMLIHLRDAADPLDGSSTRGRIIIAAVDLFAARGYGATSLRLIAERAGIQAASIYAHFENKDALVGEALKWVYDDFISFVAAPLEKDQGAGAALETLLKRVARYQLEYPGRMDAWHVLMEVDRLQQFLPATARRAVDAKRDLYGDLLEALVVARFPDVERPGDRLRAATMICSRVSWWLIGPQGSANETEDLVWSMALAIFTDLPSVERR